MFAANSLLLLPIIPSFISLAFCADSSLVVSPAYSTKQTCLSEASATGPISAQLKKAQKGGQFTHYGIGGRGACGLDIDTVEFKKKLTRLTVPINNKCSECAIDHVDLSEEAFAWLEPDTSVGVATEATITYIECP
uniref:DPBB_1 domain-containing protein n=1 Tax=Globodera pallida TaxID=36090 RepID=A0A183BXM2_GLOPA